MASVHTEFLWPVSVCVFLDVFRELLPPLTYTLTCSACRLVPLQKVDTCFGQQQCWIFPPVYKLLSYHDAHHIPSPTTPLSDRCANGHRVACCILVVSSPTLMEREFENPSRSDCG